MRIGSALATASDKASVQTLLSCMTTVQSLTRVLACFALPTAAVRAQDAENNRGTLHHLCLSEAIVLNRRQWSQGQSNEHAVRVCLFLLERMEHWTNPDMLVKL